MLRLLVAAVLALVLAVGAWALFLREEDQGHPLLVGALEDGVKWLEPEIADQRIEFATRAGFNALNVTTHVGTRADGAHSGELTILRSVSAATEQRNMHFVITAFALAPALRRFPRKSSSTTPISRRRSRASCPAFRDSRSGTSRT